MMSGCSNDVDSHMSALRIISEYCEGIAQEENASLNVKERKKLLHVLDLLYEITTRRYSSISSRGGSILCVGTCAEGVGEGCTVASGASTDEQGADREPGIF
ncbi:hypothetical protein AVEN_216856-1 [Araneus ventricosus]|uniref:Uncharacterized protein n=1 Tax=Araneus ventricosus TaxID=182803 RepID=A0A4Y2TIS8_ARAVE|nr:hypothetical protein AVEN_216856-1 [Araneus ventricosus]